MSIFIPLRLNVHEVGVCYKDKVKKEFDGTALLCMTRMRNTDRIPINIADFQQAIQFEIDWVILSIVPLNWIKRISMDQAVHLMEHARQFDGADYKLISKSDVEGYTEISDEPPDIPDDGLPF